MTAKEQVERMLGELLQFASRMLVEHGEFHPFGCYLASNGDMVSMGVEMDRGGAEDRITLLHLALLERTESAIACGVASNVWMPQDGDVGFDAVKVFLEHQDGYCAEVFCPYDLSQGEPLLVAEMFAQCGQALFFSCSPADDKS